MATARPGWSRKAQYSLFFSFIAAIAGLLIGLVLLAVSFVAPRSYAAVRGAALDATAPVTGGLRQVTATVNGLFSGAGNYWDAAHQNAQLKRERELMIQRIIEAKAISQENRELKAALQLREHSRAPVASGRVVGSSFSSPRRFAVFSAGSADGVRIGMPVRSPTGLIGRVMDAGALASRVLLVSDRASIVPARILRTGQPVISQGRGDGTVDLLITSAWSGVSGFNSGRIFVISSGDVNLLPKSSTQRSGCRASGRPMPT